MAAATRLEGRGPAAARNMLARRARGEYLFFLDADTEPLPGTVSRVRQIIRDHAGIPAFFGSYDNAPDSPALISTLKNLAHHHFHQRSRRQVGTFWCGCGVIRTRLYLENGGLNEAYSCPSVEDIELGMRLAAQRIPVRVFPELQVKHLKHWSLLNWIYTDFRHRGVPWVQLMRSGRAWNSQLNFSWLERVSSLLALTVAASAAGAFFSLRSGIVMMAALLLFMVLNRSFLSLVIRTKGLAAGLTAVLFQLTYCWICIAAFLAGLCWPSAVARSESSSRAPV